MVAHGGLRFLGVATRDRLHDALVVAQDLALLARRGQVDLRAQARRAVDLYGCRSIELEGGMFEPAHELECLRALHPAFPGLPLRLDPTPGLAGMAELATHTRRSRATTMAITTRAEFRRGAAMGSVKALLSDRHCWSARA